VFGSECECESANASLPVLRAGERPKTVRGILAACSASGSLGLADGRLAADFCCRFGLLIFFARPFLFVFPKSIRSGPPNRRSQTLGSARMDHNWSLCRRSLAEMRPKNRKPASNCASRCGSPLQLFSLFSWPLGNCA